MADVILTAAEDQIMRMAFEETMLRAAAIIDKITNDEVLEAQRTLLLEGVSLMNVTKIDRALLASCHLRACVEMGSKAQITSADVKRRIGA